MEAKLDKYCAICMGAEGIEDFKEMVDFAAEPGYNIGYLNANVMILATFVSTFSKSEVYEIFKGVEDVNFILLPVDDHTMFFTRKGIEEKLMGVFDGMVGIFEAEEENDKSDKIPPPPPDDGGLTDDMVSDMAPREKQEIIDTILDKGVEMTQTDKNNLDKLSK